jgi:hypothetical protein
VAAAVAAIDDRPHDVAGVWHLEGPDVLTGDELFRVLADGEDAEHLAPEAAAARLTELLEFPVSRGAAELFALGTPAREPGVEDAAEAFGLAQTSLEDGLRLTADRASGVR